MKTGSHSSEAIPRSLQQRIRALDLAPSIAAGTPSALKKLFSPWDWDTMLLQVSCCYFQCRNENLPAVNNKGILSRDNVLSHDNLSTMNHAPSHRSKSLIQASSVLDL